MTPCAYINRNFKPELPFMDNYRRRAMRDSGIEFPADPNKSPVGIPVKSAYEGLDTAVWLPDVSIEADELPALAVAIARDRLCVDLRKIEAYYLGFISKELLLSEPKFRWPSLLVEHAESRLNESASVELDSFNNVRCELYDDSTNVRFYFPFDNFAEYVGIDPLEDYQYESS